MPRAEGVGAPFCIVCGKVATRKDVDGEWWPPCGHAALHGIGTLRFSDEPLHAPAGAGGEVPMWTYWKRHLVVCERCTAGHLCRHGRGLLGDASPADAPWLRFASRLAVVPDAVHLLSAYAVCLPDCATNAAAPADAEENPCTCGYVDAWNAVFSSPALTPPAVGVVCPECDGDGKSGNEHDCEECGYSHAPSCEECGGSGHVAYPAPSNAVAKSETPALTPPAGEVGEVAGLLAADQAAHAEADAFLNRTRDPKEYPFTRETLEHRRHLVAMARAVGTAHRALAAQAREAEGLRAEVAIVRDRLAHTDVEYGHRCEELRTALSERDALRARVAEREVERDALRADVARLEGRTDWLNQNCTIVYFPPGGEYPIEHNMAAQKDSWFMLMDRAPAAGTAGGSGE